jgi:hypothetical protein
MCKLVWYKLITTVKLFYIDPSEIVVYDGSPP